MIIFQSVLVSLLLLLLEFLSGNFLISSGLPVFGALYLYAAYGKYYGLVSALFCGMIVDAVYFREYLVTPLIYLAVVMLTQSVIIRRFRRQLPEAPIVGGLCAGGLIFAGNILTARLYNVPQPGPDFLSMLIFQLAGGALLMFLLTVLLDGIAVRCKLPKFGTVVKSPGKKEQSRR